MELENHYRDKIRTEVRCGDRIPLQGYKMVRCATELGWYNRNATRIDGWWGVAMPLPICTMVRNLLLHNVNTLRMGDADLHFYITTVQDGW